MPQNSSRATCRQIGEELCVVLQASSLLPRNSKTAPDSRRALGFDQQVLHAEHLRIHGSYPKSSINIQSHRSNLSTEYVMKFCVTQAIHLILCFLSPSLQPLAELTVSFKGTINSLITEIKSKYLKFLPVLYIKMNVSHNLPHLT